MHLYELARGNLHCSCVCNITVFKNLLTAKIWYRFFLFQQMKSIISYLLMSYESVDC